MSRKISIAGDIHKLTPEQYKSIASVVIQLHEEQKIKEIREQVDEQTGNAKLLLQNYRKFKSYAKHAVSNIKEARIVLAEMLNEVYSLDDELKIESIIRTKERTLVMIAHIDKMLSMYKVWCDTCGEENAERRYKIIFDKYIANPTVKPSAENLAEKYGIDRSTVFADISRALEDIAPLLFGMLPPK